MDSYATLQDVLEDYQDKYCNRKCILELNYKNLANILVKFEEKDLHHLLGLHYVLDNNINATKSISMIRNSELSISDFRNHRDFYMMFSRFKNYDFLEKVFYKKMVEVCVLAKDLSRNNMRLNLVIFDIKGRTATVLGLRRINDYYKLVTLHESDARKYNKVRKTTIKNITWID